MHLLKKPLSDYLAQKGQVTVEYILLAVTLLVLFQATTKGLEKWELLQEFQERPAIVFKNMVENGNLIPDEQESRRRHPNHYESQYSPDGEGGVGN